MLRVSLEAEPGPCPKAALLFLVGSSPVSASPPFPDQQLFEPALRNSGKVTEAGVYSLQTRNGGHRKAFVPRSPTGSCLVSQECMFTERWSCEETARGWPSASQEERPQRKLTKRHLDLRLPTFRWAKKWAKKFLLFKSPSLWYSVMAALANLYTSLWWRSQIHVPSSHDCPKPQTRISNSLHCSYKQKSHRFEPRCRGRNWLCWEDTGVDRLESKEKAVWTSRLQGDCEVPRSSRFSGGHQRFQSAFCVIKQLGYCCLPLTKSTLTDIGRKERCL